MNKQLSIAFGLTMALMSASCSNAIGSGARPSYGMVVQYGGDVGISTKWGILAVSNTGQRLFAPAKLGAAKTVGGFDGVSSYGGAGVPQWVRVTWRENTTPGQYWTTGTVVGDHKIEVASRIPAATLKYASEGRGRALRLIFRVKDDGVAMAWNVEETVRSASGRASNRWYSFHGGDFACDPSPSVICTTGRAEDAPWFDPKAIRDK
jgi:hypothetical protein